MLVDRTRWLRITFFNDGFCTTPSLSLGYASNLRFAKGLGVAFASFFDALCWAVHPEQSCMPDAG